ncbi:hypothetical protein EYC80_006920 [Monilinia laxa]|uniref:Uncharacterized protein n=1 Tax=Monilinia laxa TaxID=61186 RepID=A0A5N6JZZ1_MONLA|nr:hypothetical protein EYC80_006920 [Monilinia laxa]
MIREMLILEKLGRRKKRIGWNGVSKSICKEWGDGNVDICGLLFQLPVFKTPEAMNIIQIKSQHLKGFIRRIVNNSIRLEQHIHQYFKELRKQNHD